MQTRSLQSLACQFLLQMHISYDVHLPWPLQALAHSALMCCQTAANTQPDRITAVFIFEMSFARRSRAVELLRGFQADETAPAHPPARALSRMAGPSHRNNGAPCVVAVRVRTVTLGLTSALLCDSQFSEPEAWRLLPPMVAIFLEKCCDGFKVWT